jgi:predicted transcriptional regulator
MATDALSCWFVSEYIQGKKPWNELKNIESQKEFESFITRLLDDKLIRNDDVTLLVIEYENGCEVGSSGLSIDESL